LRRQQIDLLALRIGDGFQPSVLPR
jgi:hypothetical protein